MPIEFHSDLARLTDKCRLEDAEALREWLQQNPNCALDLSGSTDLHTGVLQILLAHGRAPSAWPSDPLLAAWLKYYIDASASAKRACD